MKALFVVPSLKRAGAESQVVSLVNALDAENFDPHVFIFDRQLDLKQSLDHSKVRLHQARKKSKIDLTLVRTLADLIEREKIDVVYAVMQYSYLYAWLAVHRVRRKPGLVAALHTTLNLGRKEELQDRLLYRFVLQGADKLIFVCNSQKNHWLRRYPKLEPLAVTVYNGIDSTYFDPDLYSNPSGIRHEYGLADDDFIFCCIAGFRPEKGHKILLHAFSILGGRTKLILVGDGALRTEIADEIERLGLSRRIRCTGVLQDVRPILAISHASVLASTAVETFSMAMLESMSMGVPVIATNIGGLKEAIIPGENGMLVPPGDPVALCRAMQEAAENRERFAAYGIRARQLVIANFSVNAMARATETILHEVASSR
ncbi:MAG: glycosyltransferase [Desulfobacterales bacterium]